MPVVPVPYRVRIGAYNPNLCSKNIILYYIILYYIIFWGLQVLFRGEPEGLLRRRVLWQGAERTIAHPRLTLDAAALTRP